MPPSLVQAATSRFNEPSPGAEAPASRSSVGGAAPSITVRVYDLYGLPAEQRRDALAVTSEVLARAAVAVEWLECVGPGRPSACAQVLAPGEMVLRLNLYPHRARHILGAAMVQRDGPNVLATVYTPALIERSIDAGVDLSTVIGRVAAHEIGHLLLGSNSHSRVGLMRPYWDIGGVDPADWRFTSRDAAAMRSRLTGEGSRAAAAHTAN